MAALTEQPPVAPSTFDQDIDSFLNLDQLTYTSAEPSRSKTTLTSQPAIQNPEFVANNPSPVIFQGPSHQYDEHKQQTGLPPGALAQAMTFNQMNGMGFGGASPGYPMNGDMMSNPPMKREDSLDFNSLPTRNPSDMDLESDSMSAVPGYYFSPNPNNKNQFVDPNALGGQEVVPMGPSTQVGRMYPGMHQQQAAMARAAQQQKHHEMLRQQQMQQQHQQQQQQRRMDEHLQQTAPSMDQSRAPNPVVDERISRLLQQMRQTSVTSPDETPSPSALPQMTKAKKDEQEMDEDERLLASEEGKKLSSKERRQLRNKVSARAFRSRRKEYIGQLESEVAAKTNEAHELRLQNRALFEENARLTDLARMLLSSPHFSQFLDEMNANGIPFNNPTQPTQPQAQPSQPQPQPQPQQHPVMSQPPMQSSVPKEATPTHPTQDFTTSQTPHVGMVMVPQQTMDVSAMSLNSGWNSGIDMNYANASVFAVLEVPEPPAIDTEYLSGKGSGLASFLPQPVSAKDEAPVLEPLPVAERSTGSDIGVEDPEYEIDESDPAFALFKDSPTTAPVDAPIISAFDGLRSDKPAPVYELMVENESRAAERQLAHLCHDMEAAFQRVSLVTSHLFCRPSFFSKLASLRLSRGLFTRAFRGTLAPSTTRTPIFLPTSLTRLYSSVKPPVSKPRSPSSDSSGSKRTKRKYRSPQKQFSRVRRPPSPKQDFDPFFEPGTYILRAPKLRNRQTRNYILYSPSAHKKLTGFNFLPTPPTGNHPMKFYFQVVTTPTADTPGTSVLLYFPDKRYFFGQISEGTQRACTERGVRLSYLTDVFLTGRMEWANTGGLIGVILTQADTLASSTAAIETAAREKQARRQNNAKDGSAQPQKLEHGVPYAVEDGQAVAQRGKLTIHGPRNLAHTLATARRFVFRKGMPVYTKEYDSETMARTMPGTEDPFENPTWSDSNIKVWAMPIRPATSLPPKTASRQPSPQSPRKRSLDEYEERNVPLDPMDEHTKNQVMRQTVITDMFNSTWRMDALVETPLAEVKMPAVMFVRNPETKDLDRYTGPLPGSGEPLPDIKVLVRQPWPGATVEKLPPTTWCDEAVSYIVRNHDIRGKFRPDVAKNLNVTPGPDYAKLARGESVLSKDNQTITPEMVLGPTRLGKGLAIIDLPTPEYVDGLINRSEWNSPSVTTNLEAFLWILGPGVGDHPRLHEFVAKMSHCKHTVSSSDYSPNYLSLASIAGSSVRMAQLRKENFPVPVHDNVTIPQPGTPTAGTEIAKIPSFEPVEPGLVIDMEPKFVLNRSEVMPLFNTSKIANKMPRAVDQRMRTIQKRIKKPEFQQKLEDYRKGLPGADVEIIALGTGSSSPSKYRNVSSTLLHVPGYGYYLLDCGENTLGQLKRVFEPEQLREVLQNLRMIWISHLHADHHLGTASLIRAWFHENYPDGVPHTTAVETDMAKILNEKRLFVVSEEMMVGWLEEYAGVENYGFGRLIPLSANPDLTNGVYRTELLYRHCRADGSYPGSESDEKPQITSLRLDDDTSPLTPLLRKATGLSNLLATKVSHCRGAMAVSLVFPDGFKISFSGDCRPSPIFAAVGHGSTVLIHEATFQDNMQMSAIAKKHSTVAEALEIGRRMEARSILLTHFSQRYQKVAHLDKQDASVAAKLDRQVVTDQPPVSNDVPDIPDNEPGDAAPELQGPVDSAPDAEPQLPLKAPVVAAFDYMRVRVGDMPLAQAYAPAVGKLIDIFERASAQETEKAKLELEKQMAAKAEAKKSKKKLKQEKLAAESAKADKPAQPADSTKPAGSESAVPAEAPADANTEPSKSVWSASESESGWDTSGSDSEDAALSHEKKQ